MVDRYFKINAEWGTDDGIAKDVVVNTFHFRHMEVIPGTTPQDSANDMVDQLEEFYQAIDGDWFPDEMGTSINCTVYDLADDEPRVPVLERSIPLVTAGVSGLPHELAVCLSYRAQFESGVNRARRRGRWYIGPLTPNARELVGNKIVVSGAFTDALRDAAVAAFQTGLGVQDPKVCVHSVTELKSGLPLAETFHEAIEVWVDNAWDVQRRRGTAATIRLDGALT